MTFRAAGAAAQIMALLPRGCTKRAAQPATSGSGRAYAPRVMPHRHSRVAASGGALLALVGLWIGHTLEYLRVLGSAGLPGSLVSPVHAYMLPVAGVLVGLSALFGLRLWRAWRALSDRLDRAAAGLHRIWRGRTEAIPDVPVPRSSRGAGLIALWLPLAAVQIVLYLIQENVEAIARAQPAPGWGAITGIHWAAPLVHLYVALLLACGVRICQILFRRHEAVVERTESLLRAVARRVRRPVPHLTSPSLLADAPDRWLGWHVWRRPPPLLFAI